MSYLLDARTTKSKMTFTETMKKKLREASTAFEKLGKFLKLEKGSNIELTLTKVDINTYSKRPNQTNYWEENQELFRMEYKDKDGNVLLMEKPMLSSIVNDFNSALEDNFQIGGTVKVSRDDDDKGMYVIEYFNVLLQEFVRYNN